MSVHALGWTLLHFVWQGTLAAALLASLDVLLRRRSPQARYAAAAATLLLMLLMPLATYVAVGGLGASARAVAPVEAMGVVAPARGVSQLATAVGSTSGGAWSAGERMTSLLPMVVTAWCAGVTLLSLRFLGGLALVLRLKRSAMQTALPGLRHRFERLCRELRLSRPVRLCESALVEVPTVIGWLRPVLLLPAGALLGLSPAQLETILAHELAHIRRFDYLVNLVQVLAETLLFYHPGVWWVSQRMRVEREHCCDDVAVAVSGDAVSYARALTDLAGLRLAAPGLAMAATGGSLFQRIARLVGGPQPHDSSSSRWLAGFVALASLVALGMTAGASAQRREAPVVTPAERPKARTPGVVAAQPRPGTAPAARSAPSPEAAGAEPGPGEAPVAAQARPEGGALPLAKVIALADAGVTAEYIDEMAELGYPSLSCAQLMELRSQGVDSDFVREMKQAGYGDLSVTDLIALRSHGVDSGAVAELLNLGFAKLSVAKLIGLADAGVNGEYVRDMKGLLAGETSLPLLIELQSHGVSAEYVKEMQDLGYADLNAEALIELMDNGVDAEYVRELRDAGYAGLKVKDLIDLRSHGVEASLLKRLKGAR